MVFQTEDNGRRKLRYILMKQQKYCNGIFLLEYIYIGIVKYAGFNYDPVCESLLVLIISRKF